MAGYILADSFGGLQQAENAADSNRRMALAAAVNSAMSGLQHMSAVNQRRDELAQQQDNANRQYGLQRETIDLAKRRASDEDWNRIQSNDLAKGYLKLQQDEGTAAGVRREQDETRQFLTDADTGFNAAPSGMDPADYVKTFYPRLKPGVAQAGIGRAMEARDQKDIAWNHAQKLADTLNRWKQLKEEKAASDDQMTAYGLISPSKLLGLSEYKAAKAKNDELTAAFKKLDPIVTNLQKPNLNPFYGTAVIPTPEGGFENITPVPRHRRLNVAQEESPSVNPTDGFVPTTGGVWLKPNLEQAPPSTPVSRKYPPQFYDAVNRKIASGIAAADAVQQSLIEYGQAMSAGSVP